MDGTLKQLLEQYRKEDKKQEEDEQTRDEARKQQFQAALNKAGVTEKEVAKMMMPSKTGEVGKEEEKIPTPQGESSVCLPRKCGKDLQQRTDSPGTSAITSASSIVQVKRHHAERVPMSVQGLPAQNARRRERSDQYRAQVDC